jgi:hypothetical protein
MKFFLYPEHIRRGQPVMVFVVRERSADGGHTYWLGVYHDFVGRGQPAETTDYHSSSRQRISHRMYQEFLVEARRNRNLYAVRIPAMSRVLRKVSHV